MREGFPFPKKETIPLDYTIKPSSVRRGKSKKTGGIANIMNEKRFVHAIEASAAALGNAKEKEKERRSKELLIALFPWRRDF